jgi:branched-chain amino acid transport system substrate-binding protein
LWLAPLVVGACLASACGSEEKRPAVKVGVLLPYTGDSAAVGGSLERAVVLAVESANRGSGLGGRDLSPVFADTKSDPEHALEAVDRLLAEDIQALIGPENFEIADRILPRLKERGVLFLSPYLSDSIEYQSADNWPWFRLAPTATVLGEALAKRLLSDGHPSVAFVFTRDRYCLDFADAAMRRYQELGGTVAWKRGVEPAQVSYATDVRDFPAADTSVVALVALPLAAARLVTDVFVGLPNVRWQWYLAPHLKTPAFLDNTVASVVEGAIGVAPQTNTDPAQFAEAYQNRFLHEPPLEGVFFYYDAAALLALSFERAMVTSGSDRPGLDLLAASLRLTANPSGIVIRWNELSNGIGMLAEARSAYYGGLTGPILLYPSGARQLGTTTYWQVRGGSIQDLP